ncbi:MAG: ATP-binding cassette domain-containing protein [Candidatus Omnitrophica bacterium]|nr:ATP-binding cassette domain-containing protein [Candidatus Omnitrophota bacterium]
MIQIEGLSKSFNGQVILRGLDLTIKDGEIFAILGESGAGKSVLLKLIMGLIEPDEGRIIINGEDITTLKEKHMLKIRKKIGYLFQEGALYDFMDVYDNIAFPLREHTRLKPKEIDQKIKHILNLVDLQNVEKKMPAELSGGMRKRVGLARSIILDSMLLLCDEPTSGLDPIRSRDIMDLIKNVSHKIHCATMFTSHDLENSFRIADRLAIIKDGQIAAIGTREDIESSENSFVQEFVS